MGQTDAGAAGRLLQSKPCMIGQIVLARLRKIRLSIYFFAAILQSFCAKNKGFDRHGKSRRTKRIFKF